MLDLAARAALRGAGDVEPNPLVGAVLARDGVVLAIGHHRRFGGLHAEREAIEACRRAGRDPAGATLYVTLEPCSHSGKQPPCTEAIADAQIRKVVYARSDPGVESGGGASELSARGVACELSTASGLASRLSDPFVKRAATGRPWIIAKWAQTLDGRIATRTGESQWISGEPSRRRVHRLRGRVDCILTGLGTVLTDDPLLTARGVRRVRRVARRVVVDTHLETPVGSRLVQSARAAPTTIACAKDMATSHVVTDRREQLEALGVEVMGVPTPVGGGVDLPLLLETLRSHHGATNVLVEAGPGLLGALFAQDLVDEAVVYIAPLLLGDAHARSAAVGRAVQSLAEGRRFTLLRHKRVGEDVELTYRRSSGPAAA